MDDETSDNPTPEAEDAKPCRPTAQLQTRLFVGILAVLASGGLAAFSTLLALGQNQKRGVSLALGLGLVSILPQIWVLRAFLGLAKETDSDGLKRSSIGVFGMTWLAQLMGLADENIMPEEGMMVLMLLCLGAALGLLGYCFYPFLRRAGCGLLLVVALGLRLLRSLPRLMPGLKQPEVALLVAVILGGLSFLIIHVWLGVALIKLRARLGNMAAVTGAGYLLWVLGLLALCGWLILEVAGAAEQAQAPNQDIEEMMKPYMPTVSTFEILGELLNTALTALLFLFVKQQGQNLTPEEAELS